MPHGNPKGQAVMMPSPDDLEQCIELIQSASSPEEAFGYFCAILEASGYDCVTYSLLTDHPSLKLPKKHGLANSYPEDWMTYYNSRGYEQVDPVIHQALKSKKPFFWDDLSADAELPTEALRILNQGKEAGLHDGIAFSLSGIAGEVAGVGLARSESSEEPRNFEFLARAYLLGTFFHETYRDMLIRQRTELSPVTDRECDVLLWAAEGKTDQEIAIILGISFHTVRFHWRRIFARLDVNGRNYAITKAIRLGLIAPEIIRPPYQHW
jgi:DNA-binding CsgD family transcriptional regulator